MRACRRPKPAGRCKTLSRVVRRYLKAGLVIFGKTNLPESALKGVTDSKLFGRACDPWNFDRTPGGSSGGVAAGGRLRRGTDGGRQ
jgi:Asp-tRNA(Asn)/Glu-tRNA(Gln) amidotransferase A subunit family amidase